ncbi:DUF2252 domain-containing protein [Paraburkholderia guartelaensis]|uniref:DUF2252 domain-containing protein n=1 Tax=Paraburkholderia guartelaensis TaxID=2546446 RepID=A0A4R5L6E8_9BURK|nr:DUF2252 family protein [Paraburkholderia guartelaensis]TDG03229.1 DUF2252 domain-containing protein [Paraburkholderia guartelaensis]
MAEKSRKSGRVPAPDQRQPVLAAKRNEKMARSAHAYVRGSATRFYAWLDSRSAETLPQGPAVWICGDCHLGNLGPVADAAGDVAIQIRDLDQSVIGNPVHDLIRLGLSLATAARSSDLPGVITSRMAEALMNGYEQAFDDARSDETRSAQRPAVVRIAMKEALHRSWQQLERQNIHDTKSRIPLGKRFWPLSTDERKAIRALFESDAAELIRAALSPAGSGDVTVDVLDAAYWVKGCSSLGRRRFAVLLDIDGACSGGGPPCLVDIKEAAAAAAPRYGGHRMPRDNARRVVEGARHVAPLLGNRMSAVRLDGCAVVVRELLPQDLKFDAERLTEADAMKAAQFLALIVGQAHARQLDASARRSWLKELRGNRPKSLDAPSWLWRSIVELMVAHEAEYLEHCRRYALERPVGQLE